MDKLIEILEDLVPEQEFRGVTGLVDSGILSSLVIVSLIGEISDEFDVDISLEDLIPDNFDSVETIWAMIQKYL